MEIIFRLLKNDAFFPQEISRTSQTYRRQNHSACPACCAFLSRRARLPRHAQKMCAVTIVGTVLKMLSKPLSPFEEPKQTKAFFKVSRRFFLVLNWATNSCNWRGIKTLFRSWQGESKKILWIRPRKWQAKVQPNKTGKQQYTYLHNVLY